MLTYIFESKERLSQNEQTLLNLMDEKLIVSYINEDYFKLLTLLSLALSSTFSGVCLATRFIS
jgi:hypothetical protein